MVVNLAVVDDVQRPVFVAHRLVTVGNVDDAQPPHGHAETGLDMDAVVVGTAVPLGIIREQQALPVDGRVAVEIQCADDSTHSL